MLHNVQFSIHHFDEYGDKIEDGIYLHFDKVRIRVAKDYVEFIEFVETIDYLKDVIKDKYELLEKTH